jgi:probable rRNA maturation factor
MILNRQRKVRVVPRALQKFLRRVERELGIDEADVTVCFVGDEEIARMNREFRKKKGPTDVLSFPAKKRKRRGAIQEREQALSSRGYGERTEKRAREKDSARKSHSNGSEETPYLGDIAIAPGVARRYAKKNGRSLDSELMVLILHGVLHLLGYDHETDRGEMDRLEQKLRRRFGLA